MNSLLEAVLATPEKDEPRLVYADALIAQGDPRGEFIHVQCALKAQRGDWVALKRRERELCEKYLKQWEAPFGKVLVTWVRGFPESVVGRTSELVSWLPAVAAVSPVRDVVMSSNTRESLPAFAELPELKRIVSLEISGSDRYPDWMLGDEGLLLLVASTQLRALEELVLGPNGITKDGAGALVKAPWLNRLKKLSCGGNAVDPGLIEALPSVRELSLKGSPVPVDALARSLTRLRLCDCGPEVAKLPALPELKSLLLDHCMIRDAGAMTVAQGSFPRLEALNLEHNGVGDDGAAAIAAMQSPLVELRLSSNYIKARGARALAESTALSTLRHLDLQSNQLGVEGVTALVEGKGLPALNQLGVSHNGIYTEEIEQWTDYAGGVTGEGFVPESYQALKARFAGKPELKIE
jgi:uncharacterized protein (TIGR02996 family)